MIDKGKVIEGLKCLVKYYGNVNDSSKCPYRNDVAKGMYCADCTEQIAQDALYLLKEQEDDYKNILSDYEDLAREHEKLLDKKIPLITNGQEIIRCKDCKKQGSYDCHITSLTGQTSSDDWFCADGERRNDDA